MHELSQHSLIALLVSRVYTKKNANPKSINLMRISIPRTHRLLIFWLGYMQLTWRTCMLLTLSLVNRAPRASSFRTSRVLPPFEAVISFSDKLISGKFSNVLSTCSRLYDTTAGY